MAQNIFLKTITIKNFATFTDQTVNFSESFNAIIGETGSGKSLLLDAIQLILGARADKRLVRKGDDFFTIEANFECFSKEASEYFDNLGFPLSDSEIIIKRIVYTNGKSKSFLNHQQANLSVLQKFSRRFIDLVGQFENQKLLNPSYQIKLIDNYADLDKTRDAYTKSYQKLKSLESRIEQLNQDKSQRTMRLDYIGFQISELEKIQPSLEAEQILIQKRDYISNIEARQMKTSAIQSVFEGENSAPGLNQLIQELEKLTSDSIFGTLSDKVLEAKELLQDVNYQASISDEEEFEDSIEQIIDELDAYQKLKVKFSTDTEGLNTIYQEFLVERDSLNDVDIDLSSLLEQQKILTADLKNKALELHKHRVVASNRLSKKLTSVVRSLRMNGSTIQLSCGLKDELGEDGITVVSFDAETNPGEGYFKIKDIASGGELSRILLAIRQVLASKDSISVFLFDEIDTGMGGETAKHIGKSLASVSDTSQVIAITHLPQIAHFSDRLINVSKKIESTSGQTRTSSRVQEIEGTQITRFVETMTPLQ